MPHDVAKLAFLTTPSPGVFVLNYQVEGASSISRIEISKAHLANILIDGTALALRDSSDRAVKTQEAG